MPWEKKYNEREVLDRAMQAFWAHGYAATSMQDLVDATGVNRGSIYAGFTDKRTLFLKSLKHYDRLHREAFLYRLAATHTPRDAILAAFRAAAAPKPGPDGPLPGGCLLVNTALELSPHDDDVRALVDRSLAEVEAFFREMIEAGQDAGDICPETDAAATAQALLGLFLGLRVRMRANPGAAGAEAIIDQARAMLRA